LKLEWWGSPLAQEEKYQGKEPVIRQQQQQQQQNLIIYNAVVLYNISGPHFVQQVQTIFSQRRMHNVSVACLFSRLLEMEPWSSIHCRGLFNDLLIEIWLLLQVCN
jgi:hypothetical protein